MTQSLFAGLVRVRGLYCACPVPSPSGQIRLRGICTNCNRIIKEAHCG